MQVITATTEAAGLDAVYRDAVWLVARATSPDVVLRYDPRLADLGRLDCLEEAGFFAAQRILWIVERHDVLVATLRCNHDEYDAIYWKQPELIEIAACPGAWKALPVWVQTPIWRRLVAFVQGQEPIVHDRPELRRLAEATFRATVVRAIGNRELLEELFEDCPFWGMMDRDELLDQDPSEMRLWYRLLRQPKDADVRSGHHQLHSGLAARRRTDTRN